jgi:hypothetical protein
MADNSRIGLDEVVRYFEELEDPRSTINRRHPLTSVVVIAMMGVLAGARGPSGPCVNMPLAFIVKQSNEASVSSDRSAQAVVRIMDLLLGERSWPIRHEPTSRTRRPGC